jgi:hypothetical protein
MNDVNVLESPLGFHLFYLNGVNPATNLPLAKVKKAIETFNLKSNLSYFSDSKIKD